MGMREYELPREDPGRATRAGATSGGFMLNHTTQDGEMEIAEVGRARGVTQPMATLPRPATQAPEPVWTGIRPSYHPTRWGIVNRALALVDGRFPGKAGWLQRLVSYLFVGGFAAVVNLICFSILENNVPMPFSDFVHNLIAFVVATEISIMANFIPNDRITFSHLPGHSRSWWQRCARFHLTAIGGTIVTYIVQFSLHFGAHMPYLFAEAIAIIVALAFNFTFHHVFTYRHVEPQVL
jgi:putative flippase GtrA